MADFCKRVQTQVVNKRVVESLIKCGAFDFSAVPRRRLLEGSDAICQWAAQIDQITAAEMLQGAGVPAAPVMPNWQILSDNHLNERRFFVPTRHAEAGTFPYPGFPWRFEKTRTHVRMPAPMFAEHNRDVFQTLAGLSEREVEDLYTNGITSDHPIYANGPSL